jgi:hypothetical protein
MAQGTTCQAPSPRTAAATISTASPAIASSAPTPCVIAWAISSPSVYLEGW